MSISSELLKLVPVGEENAVTGLLLWRQLGMWSAETIKKKLNGLQTPASSSGRWSSEMRGRQACTSGVPSLILLAIEDKRCGCRDGMFHSARRGGRAPRLSPSAPCLPSRERSPAAGAAQHVVSPRRPRIGRAGQGASKLSVRGGNDCKRRARPAPVTSAQSKPRVASHP